jgi:hypothetical protein
VNIVAWFKSLSWVAILGAAATAVYFVVNAMRASGMEKRAANAEKNAENLLHDVTKKNIEKAARLQARAAKDKEKATAVKAAAVKSLEKLSESDNTMADIADRFNKRELRDRATGTS